MKEPNIRYEESDSAGATLATGATDNPKVDQKNNQDPSGESISKWIGNLSEDKRTVMSKFKEWAEVGQSYIELETKLGKSIQMPEKNSSDEEWVKWYKRIGRPDSWDGYELSTVEKPEGIPGDKAAEQSFAEESLRNGYTKEQARRVWKYLLAQAADALKRVKVETENRIKEAGTKLREDWKNNYDSNMVKMDLVIKRFADKDSWEYLNGEAGNDPRMARFVANIGNAMSEDTLKSGHPAGITKEETGEPGVLSYPQSPGMTGDNRYTGVK